MNNAMAKIVFGQFFNLTLGRFYTSSEKEKIAELIAWINGAGDEYEQVLMTVRELEREDMSTFADIQNLLLYASISDKCAPLTYCSLSVLSEMHLAKSLPTPYSSKMQWYRASSLRENALDKAMIAYVRGDYVKAIESFKTLIAREDLPVLEYITVSAYKLKDYGMLFEYAVRAQQIDEHTRFDIPWLEDLEKMAESHLSTEEAEKIRAKAGKGSRGNSIGFVA